MKIRCIKSLALGLVLAATGCGDQSEKVPGEIAATVNGKAISKAALDTLSAELNAQRADNKLPDSAVLDELVNRELLSQDLQKKGGDKNAQLMGRIENARRQLMAQADADQFVKDNPLGDDVLKKEYDQQSPNLKVTGYLVRQIVVAKESDARDIMAKLKEGEPFAELAKKYPKDSHNGNQGSEEGWASAQQMVPPLAKAVLALKDGQMVKEPVKTQFGWHVLIRVASGEQPAPAFDTVKPQIANLILARQLQQKIAALKGQAKIDIKIATPPQAVTPAAVPSAPAADKPAKI